MIHFGGCHAADRFVPNRPERFENAGPKALTPSREASIFTTPESRSSRQGSTTGSNPPEVANQPPTKWPTEPPRMRTVPPGASTRTSRPTGASTFGSAMGAFERFFAGSLGGVWRSGMWRGRALSSHALIGSSMIGSTLFGSTLLSCSLTVDESRAQCATDAECGNLPAGTCVDGLCEASRRWACIESAAQQPSDAITSNVRMRLSLPEATQVRPTPVLCSKLDLECQAPLATLAMNAEGVVAIPLEPGFEGYVSIEGTGLIPTLVFLDTSSAASSWTSEISILTRPMLDALLREVAGAPLSSDKGLAIFTADDCLGQSTAGVSYELLSDDDNRPFYMLGGLPSFDAATTDSSGRGGFADVSPGVLSISARLDDMSVPFATAGVIVKAGAVSYAGLAPRRGADGSSADRSEVLQ